MPRLCVFLLTPYGFASDSWTPQFKKKTADGGVCEMETATIKAALRLNEPLAGSFSSVDRWSMWVPDCPRAASQLLPLESGRQ